MTTPNPSPIKWGIIGLGDVCAQKSGPAFWKCTNSSLVAVMRRTPGAAREWIQTNTQMPPDVKANLKGFDNLDDFLSHSDMDAVYIATPPGSHLELAKHVAEAGLHAYVEKPVGRCGWETMDMKRAFKEKNLQIYTAYISRAYPRTQAVKDLLKEGVLGDIQSIHYTLRGTGGARGMEQTKELPWRLNASKSGGGLIMDVGCHLIDRLDYFFGPLVDINGEAANRGSPYQVVEDYVHFTAKVGEGVKVECTWDFAAKDEDTCDELFINGKDASLRMAAMSPSLPISILDKQGNLIKELTFDTPEHTAQALIQLVTNDIRQREGRVLPNEVITPCPVGIDHAVRTSKVLDEVLGGYYGGRGDAFWLRPDTWPGRPKTA